MRWRRRRRRRACGGARRTNKQTRKHSNTRTRTQTKPSTRTRTYTHTHTQTRARAPTHAATHPRARQQQQHREINTDARKHTPNHSANKADSTRRCKWTKQQRLDEARRAHAKNRKGSSYEQGEVSICARVVCAHRRFSQDTLAEWLRRRPAKPMGSPCVGSNPTGVVVAFVRSLRRRVAGQRTAVRVSARVALW